MSLTSETINCVNCNTPNYTIATKCGKCGKALPNLKEKLMPVKSSYLIDCPDCNNPVSAKAEHCPKCGRFFQHLGFVKVDRRQWVFTIAGGIVLGYFLLALLTLVFWFFLFILLAGSLAGTHR